LRDGVDELRLCRVADRFGLVKGRGCNEGAGAFAQEFERAAERGFAVTEVGAERDVGGGDSFLTQRLKPLLIIELSHA
jgi:hypothetical protein